MTSFIGRFRPSEKGLKQVLGSLECEIMEVVWQKHNTSVRDVLVEVQKDREIAYTTIMTVMNRLHKKGYIKYVKEGNAFIYYPVISKAELQGSAVKDIVKGILSNSSDLAMVHFVDEVAKDKKSLEQLETLIKQRLASEI